MDKDKLIKEYKKTVKDSLNDLGIIFKREAKEFSFLKESAFKKIFLRSASLITNKWKSKKKYIRTSLVLEAFGDLYPLDVLEVSLLTDSMVNILDDLIDEPLSKEEKTVYVLEFLRVFSLHADLFPKEISRSLRTYIEELIALAVAEDKLQNYFKSGKLDYGEFLKNSFSLFNFRAMDIDIFIDLASYKKRSLRNSLKLKKISRIFRALTIVKKDLNDIDHDKKNNLNNLFLIVGSNNVKIKGYLSDLLNLFDLEIAKLKKKSSKGRKSLLNIITKNFINLSEKEIQVISIIRNKIF